MFISTWLSFQLWENRKKTTESVEYKRGEENKCCEYAWSVMERVWKLRHFPNILSTWKKKWECFVWKLPNSLKTHLKLLNLLLEKLLFLLVATEKLRLMLKLQPVVVAFIAACLEINWHAATNLPYNLTIRAFLL